MKTLSRIRKLEKDLELTMSAYDEMERKISRLQEIMHFQKQYAIYLYKRKIEVITEDWRHSLTLAVLEDCGAYSLSWGEYKTGKIIEDLTRFDHGRVFFVVEYTDNKTMATGRTEYVANKSGIHEI